MTRKTFRIIEALVEMKSKRMSEDIAIKEALRQWFKEPLSIDLLNDLYTACQLLYKRFEWFRVGSHAVLKRMQEEV